RDDAARGGSISHGVVWAVVANNEHVEGRDPSLFGEADFHPPLKTGARASDEGFLLTADPHHHRSVRFLGEKRSDDHRHAAGDLAAEPASSVFADEDNVVWTNVQPACDRGQCLRGALRARMNVNLAVLPVSHRTAGFKSLMAGVGRYERLVKNQCSILEAGIEITVRPFV